MYVGYNTDVEIGGKHYHIQTQALKDNIGIVVCNVFLQGSVMYSKKADYSKLIEGRDSATEESIMNALIKHLHNETIRELRIKEAIEHSPSPEELEKKIIEEFLDRWTKQE